MRVRQRNTGDRIKNKIIATILSAMMLVSILTMTTIASDEVADHISAAEVVDEHFPSDPEFDIGSTPDDVQDIEQGATEPDSSVPYTGDGGSTNESADECDYDDECEKYNECVCTCAYYDYCVCECDCGECYIEIEALAEFIVTDWDNLYDVFTNLMATDGPYAVDVAGNITMNAQLNIPAGRTVYLTGGVLYQPTANARHFSVDGTLILSGITLRGTGTATYRGGIMVNGGELIMNAGSVIEDNRAIFGGGVQAVNGAIFTMYGGIISNNAAFSTSWSTLATGGGGVWTECSTFTMHDGVIKDNVANNTLGALTGSFGGGIGGGGNVGSGFESTFTMNGGTVSGNVARYGGGIRLVNSNVTINAGTISGNEAIVVGASGEGGGLELMFANLTINGGAITGNAARYGGGMQLVESTATMNGGLISGNETSRGGGGVNLLWDSIFTMNSGAISDNEAQWQGGGVGVNISSEFILNGGMIKNNIANLNSGGVLVGLESTFIIEGGTIDSNTAGTMGGGVGLSISSTLTMNDGVIANNTASTNGGGVFVPRTSTFTMNSGKIDGNTTYENGGGIYLERRILFGSILNNYGMFSMTGGTITNNTAETGDGGGIFSGAHESYQNPLSLTAYHNITFESGLISGNTAGNGRYAIPTNYHERTFGHLLNNQEINFRGSHRVKAITFDLNGGNVNSNMDNVELMLAYDNQIGISNVPTAEQFGYILTGWLFGEELLTNAELAGIVVNVPMTFVAQWEAIESDPKYRSIRIYYYLEGYGYLVNNTANNAIGREYIRRVGSTFSLTHVVDRNELDSDESYVFVGWRVYIDGIHDNTYISDLNANQLRGSFIVPVSTSEDAAVISLVAVWSIYEHKDENGNGDSNDNNDTTTPGGGNQQKLPQTGIESNVLLWSALFILMLIVGIDTGIRVRKGKNDNID